MDRQEVMDDVHGFEAEFFGGKLFRPIRAGWRGFVKFLQPAFDFHDKYCVHILMVTLLVGMALMVGWVYMRR